MNEYFLLALCFATLVLGSRMIVREMSSLSKLLHSSVFGLSVIILGFLTSLPELSVAINAEINQQPQIYAGNLMGGSFILLAAIIPLFTFFQNGLSLKKSLHGAQLFLFISLLSLPLLAALDGVITRLEAAIMILGYFVFVLVAKPVKFEKVLKARVPFWSLLWKLIKIALAAVLIYLACTQLVIITEAEAERFGIPTFLISFLALSIGTNIPELTLAFQAIFKKKSDIAFGDYVGSAAMNPLMLGVFSLFHGSYALGIDNFTWLIGVFLLANAVFLLFAMSRERLTRAEALGLIALYVSVTLVQFFGLPTLP